MARVTTKQLREKAFGPLDSCVWAELVSEATRQLKTAGVHSPRRDAEELAAHVLGISLSRLALHFRQVASCAERSTYFEYVAQRKRRVPLQLLTGVAGFRRIELRLRRGVFIPRPETEILVEVALDHIRRHCRSRVARVLDLGTGSGAIALSIASEAEHCEVVATDISEHALRCAKRNAERMGLVERVSFVACSWISAFREYLEQPFDVIVSNPPYIPSNAIEALEPEVRQYDPPAALDGGGDGLRYLRYLLCVTPRLLTPTGMVALEIGADQADRITKDPALAEQLLRHRMKLAPPVYDLQGRPRVIVASKLHAEFVNARHLSAVPAAAGRTTHMACIGYQRTGSPWVPRDGTGELENNIGSDGSCR